jgi:hypothetical protein
MFENKLLGITFQPRKNEVRNDNRTRISGNNQSPTFLSHDTAHNENEKNMGGGTQIER